MQNIISVKKICLLLLFVTSFSFGFESPESGHDDKNVKIAIHDTGKGISKQRFNTIFQPGYTSKKRGWGLGLSLARRIIEDYHSGKIKVLNSEIGKGTTMQISLKLLS